MIMNDPKKRAVSIIAAKLGSPSEEKKPSNEMGDEMDSSAGYMSAAEDMLLAVKENSPKRMMQAMKSFIEMCMNEEQSEEYSKEE